MQKKAEDPNDKKAVAKQLEAQLKAMKHFSLISLLRLLPLLPPRLLNLLYLSDSTLF
jgi:hypothetical protein